MNLNFLKNVGTGLSKIAGKSGLVLKQKSPEILLILGIGGMIGTTIMACRATLKAEGVLDEHQDKIDKINTLARKVADGDVPAEKYTEEDHKKDVIVTYAQTAVEFAKLYGPSVAVGAISIACIIGGHNILQKRNIALVAAYKGLQEAFKAYRKRVIEEHGEEADYMYKHGLRAQEITEKVVDEDGKETEEKKKVLVSDDPNKISEYAKFFDQSCREWSKDPEYNMYFLKSQEKYWNNMLRARGHVFLNEVYDSLGIERTKAGAVVGWVLGANGDNHIDFGLYNVERNSTRRFVNGVEPVILLDFNVDGVIYNVFTKRKE